MKNITYKSITIFLLFIIFMVLDARESKAVLQSNGNTSSKQTVNSWALNIRKMESLGGGMGLSETLNSNLTASSASNGIDVHMQKNTEYGALAILSASSYGNPNKITSGGTTTGNVTGVVMHLNTEWVAVIKGTSNIPNLKNAVGRYKNEYTDKYVAKKGDAITETAGWHSGTSHWNLTYSLIRSLSGSIFSYYGEGMSNGSKLQAHYDKTYASRAVVVVGEGL